MSTFEERARAGAGRIAWAGRGMPVLRGISARLAESGALKGHRIGVGLVLEPKTANLALALRDAGAEVSVYCSGRSTDQETADALTAEGLAVFAEEGVGDERDLELAREYLGTAPDIILDDGASIIRLAHREFPALVGSLLGAAEETTSGVRPLRAMHDDGALRIPVVAVNDAKTKYLFDNVYGTGQSCVMTLLDVTNLQIAGRTVVVVGYGWVGKGVALHAAALGARVVVTELDPIKALQALHDGYRVMSLADAAPTAEVVFAATGIAGAVTAAHVDQMPDGVILCTAGGGAFELPMPELDALGTADSVRAGVTQYTRADGTTVLVISEGDCLNCTDGEGNPIEVMDLSLSLQALAAELIATTAKDWGVGVHPLPEALEQAVAIARLAHEGASLEPMTDDLAAAMRSW
ncbi:adenosylhomocysteinase [Microbacterium sp. LWH12-1.2]|uniref:adenosylhomocysteinase n=1 Tax=Microbacterium sp. LWH12-1.2 TaxID=3135259 RepID=UPI0034197A99